VPYIQAMQGLRSEPNSSRQLGNTEGG
jgi:hypothetical protein